MMEGMAAGAFTAGVLSMVQRILSLEQEVNAWYAGMRADLLYLLLRLLGRSTVQADQ